MTVAADTSRGTGRGSRTGSGNTASRTSATIDTGNRTKAAGDTSSVLTGRVNAALQLTAAWAPVSRMRSLLRVPTHLGWTVFAVGVLAGVVGWVFAWAELRIIGLFSVFVLLLAMRYTIGRAEFHVGVDLNPQWASRREPAMARITVRNTARRRLMPGALIEIPLTAGGKRVLRQERPLPALAIGDSITLELEVPTGHRGVVVIGPVRTVRGDPIGLLRREMAWADPVELVVNPDTVPMGKIGAGLLRDLEGQSTNDRSVSDVSFHSLREYFPGDDLRHVHAATSARFGKPMVRQFVDTRTARLSIVVSGLSEEYADESEFETALSIGGSFAVRGVEDDQRVGVLAASQHMPARSRQSQRLVLDAFARAQFDTGLDIINAAGRMQRLAPDTSNAILITGGPTDLVSLRRAANRFGPDVRTVAVRVDATASADVAKTRRLLVITVPSLEEFGTIGTVFGKGWA